MTTRFNMKKLPSMLVLPKDRKNKNIEQPQILVSKFKDKHHLRQLSEKKRKKSIIEQFHLSDFCERATCHGLNDLYHAEGWCSRLWWIFLLLLAYIALGYQIYNEIEEFAKGPIITSINYAAMDDIPFPHVYICPFHFINWDYVDICVAPDDKVEVTAELVEFIALLMSNDTGSILGRKFSRMEQYIADGNKPLGDSGGGTFDRKNLICPEFVANETFKQFIVRHAFPVTAVIRDCAFQGESIDCTNLTQAVIDKEFGVCYSLDVNRLNNSTVRIMQNTAGIGLSVVVDLQNRIIIDSTNSVPRPIVDGALIRVESRMDPAAIGGHLLEPGTWTKMQLSPKEIHLVEFANSVTPQKCVLTVNADKTHPFLAFSNKVPYSQELCRLDCAVFWSNKTCGCLFPIDQTFMTEQFQGLLNGDRRSVICSGLEMDNCVAGVFSPYDDDNKKCNSKCLRPCDFVELDLTISQTSFPSKSKKDQDERHPPISESDNLGPTLPTLVLRPIGYPLMIPNATAVIFENNGWSRKLAPYYLVPF